MQKRVTVKFLIVLVYTWATSLMYLTATVKYCHKKKGIKCRLRLVAMLFLLHSTKINYLNFSPSTFYLNKLPFVNLLKPSGNFTYHQV
jgi:hypothetical protein